MVLLVILGMTGLWLGADVSSLAGRPEVQVRVEGTPMPALEALRQAGLEWVRLRLWHGEEHLQQTISLAQRAQALGFRILLAIHYSDTWADPAQQYPPVAWQGLPLPVLEDSVYHYTHDVLQRFRAAGVLLQGVQVGNEIDHGFLWEPGRFRGTAERSWGLVRLLASALRAVRGAPDTLWVLLSITPRGVPVLRALQEAGIRWDLTGVSYYPWWHGSLDSLRERLIRLHEEFQRPVLVLETAYPWTLAWADDTHNPVGSPTQLLPEFPATPTGQARFLRRLLRMVAETPGGLGVFYWEPVWLPARRPGEPGSPWENLALFDFQGRALPALQEFQAYRPSQPSPASRRGFSPSP